MRYSGLHALVTVSVLCSASVIFTDARQVISCSDVKASFAMKNLSTPVPDAPIKGVQLQVCQSDQTCCTPAMEAELRDRVHRDFSDLLHQSSKSLQGRLASTAASLRNDLKEMAWKSRRETEHVFVKAFKRVEVLAREPIRELYADMVRYLDADALRLGSPGSPGTSPVGASMPDAVARFFAKLFPVAFHTIVAPACRVTGSECAAHTPEYENCLASKMTEVQPFGEAPQDLADTLGRALEVTRVLLGALRVGADVLNSTDSLLSSDGENSTSPSCPSLLLRLWSCPLCAGLPPSVRPCQGYCLNVLRGCVTSRASELDQPWSSFLEAAAKLAGSAGSETAKSPPSSSQRIILNAEEAIQSIEGKISEAIMYALENGPAVVRKVRRACGELKWVNASQTTSDGVASERPLDPEASASASEPSRTSKSSFAASLRELQESLLQSQFHFANLAEVLCADEGFAEPRDSHPCWNGERVGEYTKVVVATSESAQRYNPELPWRQRAPDPRIAQVGDSLRHVRQVLQSQLAQLATQVSETDSYLRDEEGSGRGSGRGHDAEVQWSDDEDRNHVNWSEQGSGSGDDGLPIDSNGNKDANWMTHGSKKSEENSDTRQTSDAGRLWSRQPLVVICTFVTLRIFH